MKLLDKLKKEALTRIESELDGEVVTYQCTGCSYFEQNFDRLIGKDQETEVRVDIAPNPSQYSKYRIEYKGKPLGYFSEDETEKWYDHNRKLIRKSTATLYLTKATTERERRMKVHFHI